MNNNLPEALLKAQKKGIAFFMSQEYEWKLELEGSAMFLEDIVGCPVLIFANNGYGDNLFLKKKPDGKEHKDRKRSKCMNLSAAPWHGSVLVYSF